MTEHQFFTNHFKKNNQGGKLYNSIFFPLGTITQDRTPLSFVSPVWQPRLKRSQTPTRTCSQQCGSCPLRAPCASFWAPQNIKTIEWCHLFTSSESHLIVHAARNRTLGSRRRCYVYTIYMERCEPPPRYQEEQAPMVNSRTACRNQAILQSQHKDKSRGRRHSTESLGLHIHAIG